MGLAHGERRYAANQGLVASALPGTITVSRIIRRRISRILRIHCFRQHCGENRPNGEQFHRDFFPPILSLIVTVFHAHDLKTCHFWALNHHFRRFFYNDISHNNHLIFFLLKKIVIL